jgi:hypothetical protein
MGIGIFELVILLTVALTFIVMIVLAAVKLIKSKLTPKQKIAWIIAMLFFQFPGLIIFLIYHDIFLLRELRGNL